MSVDVFGLLKLPLESLSAPAWYDKSDPGRKVFVQVSDDGLRINPLLLVFKRKIVESDVTDGRLQSCVCERVQRKGGKRITALKIDSDTAEELYHVLHKARKDIRRREKFLRVRAFLFAFAHFEMLIRRDVRR